MILRGAIFDMDGTLLDSERVLLDAMDAAARDMGLEDLQPAFREIHGLRADLAEAHLSRAFEGRGSYEAFSQKATELCIKLEEAGIPLKPNAIEVLSEIQDLDLPIAVATSTQTAKAEEMLSRSGLRSFFTAVVGGDQVSHAKPNPEIYHKAAELLGLPASSCAAFEDSAPGTRAAHGAGCLTVQIPDFTEPDDSLRALGHLIRPDLRSAAQAVGLLVTRR